MSKSYTPGLKILKNTVIRKERKLPLKGDINCSKGDTVKYDNVVASTFLPGNIHMVNVANQLNVEPDTISDYLTVSLNQEVDKGDIIAENKGLFGFFKSQVISPFKGKISNVSKRTGQIMISEPEIPVEVNAYIDGSVIEVIDSEGVVVESKGALIQGIIGVGGEKSGYIEFLSESDMSKIKNDSSLDDRDFNDKIVVIEGFIDKRIYDDLSSMGVAGIVAGGFDYQSLSDILGYKLGVAITGTEEISATLIVTEGFGKVKMSQKTYDILKENNRNRASINGATQIRAGVIRPELVISADSKVDSVAKEFNEMDLIIKEGSKVRVIREPHFGDIGIIKKLPTESVAIESETKARVAEVEFLNKKRKLVPRANLEIILE